MSRIKSIYPQYEHWQKSGNIKIISDPHFGDVDREFMGYKDITNLEQCNKYLEDINSGDTVVCLGDCGDASWFDFIKRQRKHLYFVLVCGNHDRMTDVEPYFDEIYKGPVIISSQIILSHEPIEIPGMLNISGHNHGEKDWYHEIFSKEEYGKTILKRFNLAGNVFNFGILDLNHCVNKVGVLKDIPSIHRLTIDYATEHSLRKER